MNRKTKSLLVAACLIVSGPLLPALAKTQPSGKPLARTLQSLVNEAARKTLEKFADSTGKLGYLSDL